MSETSPNGSENHSKQTQYTDNYSRFSHRINFTGLNGLDASRKIVEITRRLGELRHTLEINCFVVSDTFQAKNLDALTLTADDDGVTIEGVTQEAMVPGKGRIQYGFPAITKFLAHQVHGFEPLKDDQGL